MSTPIDVHFDALNVDEIIDPARESGIVSSKSISGWESLSPVKQFPGKISKSVIPIDFRDYRMMVVTNVSAGQIVDTHRHEESVFRYVVSGEMILNGTSYSSSDWVLVPANTPYRIESPLGYVVVASYGVKCGAPHDKVVR